MSSIVQREIEHFSKDSSRWWDENGPFKPLHELNPIRLSYIKEQICRHYGRDSADLHALKGLSVLDIGCGGGLVCEPLARLGAHVSGADADSQAIEVACAHAQESGLKIAYHNKPAEELRGPFDVVLALEVIEHVQDPASFVKSVSGLLRPGGLAIFSTLNRTAKSYALGIVAAEYLLGWVPKGTHRWRQFMRPSELARHARAAGLSPVDAKGLVFNPARRQFALHNTDLDVNYLLSAVKG